MKLSVDRREELIDDLARRLGVWGLAAPAIALLETHKPLNFIASQTLLVFQPFLTPFLRDAPLEEYSLLLEDRSNVERIIYRLEQLRHELSNSE
jgi:hypothetical protein